MPQSSVSSLYALMLMTAVLLPAVAHASTLQSGPAHEAATPCQADAGSAPLNAAPPGEESFLVEAAKRANDFAAQKNLGEFYLQQNRLRQGIGFLERALLLSPEDYDTGYDLSLAYLKCGNLSKASAQLRTMIARKETGELDSLLAEVFERSGDYQNAATTYKRAVDLDPSEDNIFDLASFLLQHPHYEGFLEKALTVFRYGVSKYPHSAKLAVGLGVVLYSEGKYDDAVETLCGAVDLNPADPKPYQFLGKVSKGSPALMPKIRDRLEGFVHLYPDNGPANYYYAMILWQQSDKQAAPDLQSIEALLKRATLMDPDLYEAHFQLGVLYQDENKYDDAIAELNQALRIRPDFNRAHYRLVLLYNRTHQKQLAEQQLAILKQIKKQDATEESEDNLDRGPTATNVDKAK